MTIVYYNIKKTKIYIFLSFYIFFVKCLLFYVCLFIYSNNLYVKINKSFCNSTEEIEEIIKKCDKDKKTNISFIWSGEDEIEEAVWKRALKNTEISNLSFSCFGVDGRRLYIIKLIY